MSQFTTLRTLKITLRTSQRNCSCRSTGPVHQLQKNKNLACWQCFEKKTKLNAYLKAKNFSKSRIWELVKKIGCCATCSSIFLQLLSCDTRTAGHLCEQLLVEVEARGCRLCFFEWLFPFYRGLRGVSFLPGKVSWVLCNFLFLGHLDWEKEKEEEGYKNNSWTIWSQHCLT